MAVLLYSLLLLLSAYTTVGQWAADTSTITEEIYKALHDRLKDAGYDHVVREAKKSIIQFEPVSKSNITAMVAGLARKFDEMRNYLLDEDLTMVKSTRGVRVCCDNTLNLQHNSQLNIMSSTLYTCVMRGKDPHHIGNWTIKKMPKDIHYLVTVTSVKTEETVIFPSIDICHSELDSTGLLRLEPTELMKTRPKDVVIVMDMSIIIQRSTFKDSQKWLDAQNSMLDLILKTLSESDRVIVVATQNGRRFTKHVKRSCQPNDIGTVYREIIEHLLMHDDSHSDTTNSDLSALVNQLEEVFDNFPKLHHKRDNIAVLFVASKNASEENIVDRWIEIPFLNRINLISVCIGNIPGSNRPFTTDAIVKQHLEKYGSYLGVSSMIVDQDFTEWFKKSILPTGTLISNTGGFPEIGSVLKMCYRKEESFVCLLAQIKDIYSAVDLSKYIKSYWILLDEYCRVLIHPKSSYRSGKISEDLPLYESKLRINMREAGCKIISEDHEKDDNSPCQKVGGTDLTLCLIVKEKDRKMELYPNRSRGPGNEQFSYTPRNEGECRYKKVILRTSPTVTNNSDSVDITPATYSNNRELSPASWKPKNNVRSLGILKDSINNPEGALSTFVGFIDGVFIMDPGSSHTLPVDYTTKEWWQRARQSPNLIIVVPPHVDYTGIWSNPTITISQAILLPFTGNKGTSHHLFGVFGMVFDLNALKKVFKRTLSKLCPSMQKRCFIIDQDGFIIYPLEVNLFHSQWEDLHITRQEPSVARLLYHKGILQKSYCTVTETDLAKVIWKVVPIVGSKTFGRGNTIHFVNQTNLYVVEVDRSQAHTLQCDCQANPGADDLCSCGKQLRLELCNPKEAVPEEVCPPAHPNRFKAVEIKPALQTGHLNRCPFLKCADLTSDGERTCIDNKCQWCKLNHTGVVYHICSPNQPCLSLMAETKDSTTHPSEKYFWIGIAGATAIILLLCVIVIFHIRSCLQTRRKAKDNIADNENMVDNDNFGANDNYGYIPAPFDSVSEAPTPPSITLENVRRHTVIHGQLPPSSNIESGYFCSECNSCLCRTPTILTDKTDDIIRYHDDMSLRGPNSCRRCQQLEIRRGHVSPGIPEHTCQAGSSPNDIMTLRIGPEDVDSSAPAHSNSCPAFSSRISKM